MVRSILLALVLAAVLCPSPALAQCASIGEQVCRSGSLYTCQTCGAVNCLVFSGKSCGVKASPSPLAGKWSGLGHQSGGGLDPVDYDVVMTINAAGGGAIDYPTLSCGGTLTEVSKSGTQMQFREHITYGDCIDGGLISVNLSDGKLAWTWTGGDIGVVATLERSRE